MTHDYFDNPAAALCVVLGLTIIALTAVTAAFHGTLIVVIYAIEWGSAVAGWLFSLSPWRAYAFVFGVGVVFVCSGALMQRLHDRWLQ